MILKDGTEYRSSLRNRMVFLLLVEINNLHDCVYKFQDNSKEPEFKRLKKYLLDKIHCE